VKSWKVYQHSVSDGSCFTPRKYSHSINSVFYVLGAIFAQRNSFKGSIDPFFAELTNLRKSPPSLSSGQCDKYAILHLLGIHRRAERFEVEDNALSGSFPNFIWNATALGKFQCETSPSYSFELILSLASHHYIFLSGTLDLGYNSFSGTLSTDIGLAVGLQILHLRRIGLTGTIPTEIATLDRLREFALEFNEFEGPIPSEIGNLNSLGKQTKT
jgi:hypothetical protein